MNKSDKNKILYLLLIAMLIFSIAIIYSKQDECVEVGNFGKHNNKNISFSDFGNKVFNKSVFSNN